MSIHKLARRRAEGKDRSRSSLSVFIWRLWHYRKSYFFRLVQSEGNEVLTWEQALTEGAIGWRTSAIHLTMRPGLNSGDCLALRLFFFPGSERGVSSWVSASSLFSTVCRIFVRRDAKAYQSWSQLGVRFLWRTHHFGLLITRSSYPSGDSLDASHLQT